VKWQGVVDEIQPIPGMLRERRVLVKAVDWMDEAARATIRGVPVQLNQRSDQLLQTILETVARQPDELEIDFGMESYPYALDGSRDEGLSVLSEFQKLANSELGFIYVKGSPTTGSILVFENRQRRGTTTASVGSFAEFNDFIVKRSRDQIINRVIVKIHPRRVDALSAPEGGVFDPSTLSGLTLWLKADSLALSDGQRIQTWPDESGNGRDFTQGTGGQRPLLKTGILNGMSVVRFDGVNDNIGSSVGWQTFFSVSDATAFVVYKRRGNPSATYGTLFSDESAGSAEKVGMRDASLGTVLVCMNNDGNQDTASKTGLTGEAYIATWLHTGGNLSAGANDTRDSGLSTVASGATITPNNFNVSLGAEVTAATNYYNGDIAEVLFFNVALSEADRISVESYLAQKYGIELPYTPTGVGTAATVVFNLDANPAIPRMTSLSLLCPYRDQDQKKARIGSIAQLPPEAGTDYTFNSAEDDSGIDLTAQLSVSASFGGNAATVTIINNGPQDGYLTFFQIRGLGIYDEGEILREAEDEASQEAYGENVLTFDMPYQSDLVVGGNAAYYLLAQSKAEVSIPDRVGFIADAPERIQQAILREPSDRIDIVDDLTAVNGSFFIQGYELYVDLNGLLRCTWTVIPALTEEYWILDSDTRSQLGETTRLAFGFLNRYWILGVSVMGLETRLS
jgi:hypothetical protein